MIFGIGTDITDTSRFKDIVSDQKKINRFFNEKEQLENSNLQLLMEHYSSRFAAKEAFGKALGTGIRDFPLTDIFVQKDALGKPELVVQGKALEKLNKIAGKCKIHLSLSHEKNYAVAYLIIEQL